MVPMVFWYHKLLAEKNSLKLRFTEKKEVWNGIKWNLLLVKWPGQEPEIVIYQIVPSLILVLLRTSRRILRSFCYIRISDIICKIKKEKNQQMLDFPTVEDGVRGMAFIENVIASGKSDQNGLSLKFKI
jgi:hypothetical protein